MLYNTPSFKDRLLNPRPTYLEITYCAWIKGDVNLDGVVDDLDVTACQNHILNTQILTAQGLINADMNEDGEIDYHEDFFKKPSFLTPTSIPIISPSFRIMSAESSKKSFDTFVPLHTSS